MGEESKSAPEEALRRQNALLHGINQIVSGVFTCETEEELGDVCLRVAEELTRSRCGFIGLVGADGRFNDIANSDPDRFVFRLENNLGHTQAPSGHRVHGICDRVLLDGKSVLTNDPTAHPDCIAVSEGHSLPSAFIGVPLTSGEQTIGMVGLVKREGGYHTEDLQILETLSDHMVQALMRKKSDSAQKKTEQMLTVELENTRLLQQFSAELIQGADSETLCGKILDTAVALLHADFASMQRFYPERGVGGELQLLGHRGFSAEAAESWAWVRPESECVCGIALRTGKRVVVPDIEVCDFIANGGYLEIFRQVGIRAVQTTPLISRSGTLLGMLSTHWRNPHDLSVSEMSALDQLARQTADLIERRQTTENLRRSEERFRILVQSASQAVWESDPGGLVVKDSPSWRSYTGQAFEEWRGTGWIDAVHPDDRARVERQWCEAVAAGHHVDTEFRLRSADGEWRWTNLHAAPVQDGFGKILKWVGMNIDITDRKRAEEALYQQEERFRALITASSDLMYRMSPDWREMRQLDSHNFLAQTLESDRTWLERYIPPDDQPQVIATINEAIRTKSVFDLEHRVCQADGTLGWTHSRAVPILDDNSIIVEWFGVGSDINERKEAEAAIREAKVAAEEANRAKSEFLANMSHEIRTPMTIFMAAIEHLLQIDRNPERRNLLEMADQSAQRLRALIDDILDFSRIEAGKVEIAATPFELRAFLRQAVEIFSLPAKEKSLRLDMEVAAKVPSTVVGDTDRLWQLLINLIGNAVKFTHEGEIRISVRRQGNFLEFSVMDTGIGIEEDKLELLFQSFSQGDTSFTRQYGGTGLGLAISKGLVELMGGEISVWSRKGQGSKFTFTLPLRTVESKSSVKNETPKKEDAEPRAVRILLAEDDPMIQQMITVALKQKGWQVESAETGREALQKWSHRHFDLVFMDVQLPEMNGLEATRTIREKEVGKGERTWIIGLTAHARHEIRDECLGAGMDQVLTKPVKLKDLYTAVVDCIGNA